MPKTARRQQNRQANRRQEQPDRRAVRLLWVLVGAGVVLRLLLLVAHSPGFISSSDSAYYLTAAHSNVFVHAGQASGHPWPAGYPIFLGLLYQLSNQLTFVIVVQHALGVATAVLWFATVRRVVSAMWALLPAGVVLFAGPAVFLEHAPLSESLFAFLIAVAVYGAVRGADSRSLPWMLLAGGVAASAACVRVVGVPLAPLLAAWMLVGIAGSVRQRATGAVAVLAAAFAVGGLYLAAMKHETGYGGPALVQDGNWSGPAPGVGREARAGYLERVPRELARFWSSDNRKTLGGYNYEGVIYVMDARLSYQDTDPVSYRDLTGKVVLDTPASEYPTSAVSGNVALSDVLHFYERLTRIQNVSFLALLLLAGAGLALARGRQQVLAALLAAVAALIVLGPVLMVYFDARYVIPGYGPLAGAAAVGGAMLWQRVVVPRREQRRPPSTAPPQRPKGRARRAASGGRSTA